MAVNPNLSRLDPLQALRRTVNADEDTLRVEMGASTGFAIEIDEADGDSIAVRSLVHSDSAVVSSTATGVVINPIDVEGYSDLQLVVKVTSALTGSATGVLQVSPAVSGDVWIDTAVSVNIAGTTDVLSSVVSHIALRARVNISASTISAGAATVYLMARG